MDKPVFPQGVTNDEGKEIRRAGGMSLREYFAGQALIGCMTAIMPKVISGEAVDAGMVATVCWQTADAMFIVEAAQSEATPSSPASPDPSDNTGPRLVLP